jgi:hypothetical protein
MNMSSRGNPVSERRRSAPGGATALAAFNRGSLRSDDRGWV